MKKLWIVVCLLISVNAFGQGSKFSVGLDLSRTLPNVQPFGNSQIQYDVHSTTSVRVVGAYALNDRLELALGFEHQALGFDVTYNLTASQPNDPFIPVTSSSVFGFVYTQLLLRVYLIKTENVLLFIRAGFAPGFLVARSEVTSYADGSGGQSTYLNDRNLSLLSGIGMKFRYSDKYSFLLGIPLDIYMDGFDNFMEQHVLSYGIKVGVVYTFKGECDTCPSFN